MRYLPRALLAGGMGFAVSLLAACGGGAGLLSANQASKIQHRLNSVSNAVAAHNCAQADTRAVALARAVGNLPPSVNVKVRLNLIHGVSTASQLAGEDCRRTTSTPTTPPPTTTQTTQTTTSAPTTPTTTTTTPTTPPTTPTTPTTPPTTPTTPPTTPTPPPTTTSPSGGGGLSNGGSGGGGGGSGGQGSGGGGPGQGAQAPSPLKYADRSAAHG